MLNRVIFPVCFLAALLALFFAVGNGEKEKQERRGVVDNVFSVPVSFQSLRGWQNDDFLQALPALRHSCKVRLRKRDEWRLFCDNLIHRRFDTSTSLRVFLEKNLQPYAVGTDKTGIFTGYYEPELRASRVKTARFKIPLFGFPDDMTVVMLNGKKVTGRVKNGVLTPYPTRRDIDIDGVPARVLAWLEHKADAFVLHIQGSGVLTFPDGKKMRLSYAADNGHPFVGIGSIMMRRGILKKGKASMRDIRDWLIAHPDKADDIMHRNPRYIFFKINSEKATIGALGVPLTPRRSLAVDTDYVPLGSFLWLETQNPAFHRLVTAQDTGGAIKGPVRGDFFFGTGDEAFQGASGMKASGTYFILTPKQKD